MAVLILHGVANHRPPAHWQFQLAAALAAGGVDVRYPSLPDAEDPDPAAWDAAIEADWVEMARPRIVVCHSLGVEAWLARGQREPADALLLVAPPGPEALLEHAPRFTPAPPFAVPLPAELWCSDGDPYNAAGAAQTHGEPFGLPVRTFPGAGHFTPEDGYGRWPEAEAWVRAAMR